MAARPEGSNVPDVLVRICARRRAALAGEASRVLTIPAEGTAADPAENPFWHALNQRRGNAVIAEIKMGSPKLGSLVGSFDPERQAELYAENGAAALSVVVEPDFFYGSYELLQRCRVASGLPAIAKDFIVHPVQLRWAAEAGAGAVLLIAALHDGEGLLSLATEARRLGLVPLVETHSRDDVDRLGDGAWELVGVNNRDLRDFSVDLGHSIDLLPSLPASALRVAESGIQSRDDVVRLRDAGFHAFLVGESLVTASDPGRELRRLLGEEAA